MVNFRIWVWLPVAGVFFLMACGQSRDCFTVDNPCTGNWYTHTVNHTVNVSVKDVSGWGIRDVKVIITGDFQRYEQCEPGPPPLCQTSVQRAFQEVLYTDFFGNVQLNYSNAVYKHDKEYLQIKVDVATGGLFLGYRNVGNKDVVLSQNILTTTVDFKMLNDSVL